MADTPLELSTDAGDDGPVLTMAGEADASNAALLREQLSLLLADRDLRTLTIDATKLAFADSAALMLLMLAARALQGRHGQMVLLHPQPVLEQLIELTGISQVIDIRA